MDVASPLHIVFLDSWYTDRARGSGSTVAISGLGRALEALGHRVTHLPPRRTLPGLDATRLLYNVGLRRRLPGVGADLVVGFDFDGCFARGRTSPPYVVALKGVMADELRYESGVNRLRFAALSKLERLNARRADRVIVTSEHSRRAARQAYHLEGARVHVVPEGIDVGSWSNLPEDDRPSGSPPVIVSVARQYRRKNTAALLQAIPLVRREVPEARVRVIGEGPELPRLRSLAASIGLGEGVVTFTGSVEGPDELQRELVRADLFCLPSRQEGFGIVFLEAMAAGLPIVAARAGATPEVAPHGETSLLVDPDDVPGLAHALVRLLREPELRRRLAAGGERRWRRFAWPAVAARFLEAAGPA